MFSTFGREVHLGLRGLLRDRGFAVTALLSIGLGVGANAAIFSLVDQALFRQLPVREPERLVLLDWRGSFVGHGWGSDNLMSYPFYRDLRDGTDVFDGVFGRAPTAVNLAFENSAEPVGAEIVTGSYFSVLGVRPWMGRLITESDDERRGEHPVVVVSFDYWRTHLGERADIVGRTVLINTHPMTIVGVAEAGFHGIDWGAVPAIWIPTMMKREATPDFDWLEDRRGRWLHVFGRLRPGMSREQAQTALQPWFKAMLDSDTRREDWPKVTGDQQQRFLASSLALIPAGSGRSDLRGRLEQPLLVLLGATAIVLVLSCVNVANLYLARGFARRRETALRLALGASRGRIVRELLVQSAILAIGGAFLGLLFAPFVVRVLLSFLPSGVSGVDLDTAINPRVFGFALLAALVTAVLFSLAPAFRAARAQPSLALKEESSAVSGGLGLRKVLVVGQIALALVLLIGAGLFVRTLSSLRAQGPGFATANTILLRIDAARSGYDAPRASRLMHTLLDRFRALPEVEKASISVAELLAGGSWNQPITIDAGRRIVTDRVVHCNAISPGFFDTLGVPILAGRDFTEHDARDDAEVIAIEKSEDFPFRSAIINESLARRYFGDASPIGARLGLGNQPDTRTTVTIVGVVKTFSYRGIRQTDDQAFFPMFETSMGGGGFWIRTRVAPQSAFATIRSVVRSVDPTLPISRMTTVDDQIDRLLANERLLAMLATAFAGLAILLAVVGVYGVISFVVANRTREIGIRVALGATRASAIWLILRDTALMLGCGVLIGLPSVWLLGSAIGSQLFGVEPTDWPTIAAAAALVVLAALGASALPVRRATAIDPIRALRCE
ncbi:MAG TPA: ABC transporter permease [Vicinamibacterales bacterium]|jgi:predicted permease|nr:ABC transporter permease [Vicinamibacterales bacterium]